MLNIRVGHILPRRAFFGGGRAEFVARGRRLFLIRLINVDGGIGRKRCVGILMEIHTAEEYVPKWL